MGRGHGWAPAGTICLAALLGARWTPPGTQPASVCVRRCIVGAACSSQKHVLTATTASPLTPTGQTAGRQAGQMGLGRRLRSAHGSEGQSHLTGFSAASPAALSLAAMPLTFSGARRHVRSGPRAVSRPKEVILRWTCCLRTMRQAHSLCCAYPDPALSLLLTGVTALFYPQAGLGCLWPAGQLVRVTQGQNRP